MQHCVVMGSSFTIQQILALLKLKAFADDKFIVAEMLVCLFDRGENNVGKGENVW